jgi:hypothetical protein
MAPLGDKIVTAATAGGPRRGLPATPATGESADAIAGFAPAVGRAALPAGLGRVPAVAAIALASALCWNGMALADDPPAPPPATTTVPDAPPPEPYQPPARVVAKPKAAVNVSRPAPASRTRTPAYSPPRRATYTPPPVVARPSVQSPARKSRSKARVARKRQTRPRRTADKQPSVKVTLAPMADVLAAMRSPVSADRDDNEPYLWLAGLSFAALAVAGSSVLRLTLRSTESSAAGRQ